MTEEKAGVGDRILILILQIVGFVTALLFGVFSILSWKLSEKAIAEANTANIISFLSLCAQITSENNVSRDHSKLPEHYLIFRYRLFSQIYVLASLVSQNNL